MKKEVREGKELKFNCYDDINVKFGTVDDKKQKAVYIEITTWIEPKENHIENYIPIIKRLQKNIYRNIYDSQSLLFKHKETIVDIQTSEVNIEFNKKSYLSVDINLSLNKKNELTKLVNELKFIVDSIHTNLLLNNDYFYFNKIK